MAKAERSRREIAPTVIVDTRGRLLLQLRDNIPTILYPGKIGLFGGHREGDETFLACAVRELHEELSYELAPERFMFLARREGADSEVPGGTVHAVFFVVRDVPVEKLTITEGTLYPIEISELESIRDKLTPSASFALSKFLEGRPSQASAPQSLQT